MNVVTHLKLGKSDGSEGLFSDHFIHGTRKLYAFLSILFTLFPCHGFSTDSMILGTMIPIPMDKNKSLCSSNNYRAIALSSILSKILDWIIPIRVKVRVRNIYFDNEKHDIEETNTETFMCRSMSATIAYIELHMITK